MKSEIELGGRRYRLRLGQYNNIVLDYQREGEKGDWGAAAYHTKWESLVKNLRDIAMRNAAKGVKSNDLLVGIAQLDDRLSAIEHYLRDYIAIIRSDLESE